MKSSENLTTLYEHSKANLKTILNCAIIDDTKLLELIDKLTFDNSFSIKNIDDYNLDEIAKVFRFYEELLKKVLMKIKKDLS